MNWKWHALALALAAFHHASASAERVGWEVADGGNGHWYEVATGPLVAPGVSHALDWIDANLAAQDLGGHLATIASAKENAFVFALADAPGYWTTDTLGNYFGPWLGAWQEPDTTVPAANWRWVTGEPFQYANWHPGEPNDMFGYFPEDRIVYFAQESVTGTRSPFWNDEQQRRLQPVAFVVEFVPEPASALLLWAAAASLRIWSARHAKKLVRQCIKTHGGSVQAQPI